MLVYPQPCTAQSSYRHLFFQDNLGYHNIYAAVMSHECIKSYMTIKTEEKTKRKLSFTKINSKHTENSNEQGFWLLKFVLPCLGNHGEKNKHDHQHTSKTIDIFCREVHSFFQLFIFQKIICAISGKSCCLQWHRGSDNTHQTLTGDSPACISLFGYCQG